jgi:2-polyprenyl-6-hydroxyphenyl methylase/3-demethylubiquinone-9 3-methyltransferase
VRQFDFGKNWSDFSSRALTPRRVVQARINFSSLIKHAMIGLNNRTFLDIGFGQGLSLLSAASEGARVVGCDINPTCGEVLARNRAHFPELEGREIPIAIGSILDDATLVRLRGLSPAGSGYDFVHSWGVLHHTGKMWKAVDNACDLVAPGGVLVLALYNRHWSSPLWTIIKRVYCVAPAVVQRIMVGIFYPVILAAKALVTRSNPFVMERGMDFYYNVVDWVGGFPYEYATPEEVAERLSAKGFTLRWQATAGVPTGCNEQIFVRSWMQGRHE